MILLEIWASGAGSNAEMILNYFRAHENIKVDRIAVSNPNARAVLLGPKFGISDKVVTSSELSDGSYLKDLQIRTIDYIILAGFLKLVPSNIVQAYNHKMLNIHPALLPKYGGKNMYGDNVHLAVLSGRETQSGITIHEVNEEFDKGSIIAQFRTSLDKDETLTSLKNKVLELEHLNYAPTIEQYISDREAKTEF